MMLCDILITMYVGDKISSIQGRIYYKIHQFLIRWAVHVLSGSQEPWKVVLVVVVVVVLHDVIHMRRLLRTQWDPNASVAIAEFKGILVLTALV